MPLYDAFETHTGADFTLERPAGWVVVEDARGRIAVEGDGAQLAIWPVTANEPVGDRGGASLQALAGQLCEGVAWGEPTRLGEHVWTAVGEGREAATARLVLGAPTAQGQPVWLFAATAPDAARLDALAPLAERVFRSYRPVAPKEASGRATAGTTSLPSGAAPPAVPAGGTRFAEPTEGAFAITVPPGWEAQAGLVRYGPFATPWYRLRAADGAELRYFDPRIPTSYQEPGPVTQFMGRSVGSVVDGVMVRPYTPPTAFAAEYAAAFAQELGGGAVEVTEQRGHEETVAAWPPAFRQAVEVEWQRGRARMQRLMPHVQSRPDYGAVAFTAGPLAGLVYTLGSRFRMPDGQGGTTNGWGAHPFAVVGPDARLDALVETLHAVGASRQANPQWEQQQEHRLRQKMQHDRQVHQQQMQVSWQRHNARMASLRASNQQAQQRLNDTYNEISDITHQGYMSRQQSGNEMHRQTVNAFTEQADIYNPDTGETTWGVSNHADHYWVDAFGNTVGTVTDENPDPFRFTRGQNLDDLYDTGGV